MIPLQLGRGLIEVDAGVDHDDELEIRVEGPDGWIYRYLTRKDMVKLRGHLNDLLGD